MPELFLGGAQITTSYGSRNNSSALGPREWQDIMRIARIQGFSGIDTAPTYGDSEKTIGEGRWGGKVHTKLDPSLDPAESVAKSALRLGRQRPDALYLFHNPPSHRRQLLELEEVAKSLRDSVGMLGASVYELSEAETFQNWENIDIIQFPISIFDRRFAAMSEAKQSTSLFGRSALLQGTLANPGDSRNLPPKFRNGLREFADLSEQLGQRPMAVALRWALAQTWLDGLVLGVNNMDQLTEILAVVQLGPLNEEEMQVVSAWTPPPWNETDPRKWSP